MKLPFFYISHFDGTQKEIVLDEDTSKHVVQVLRMREGERLNGTDGKGCIITAEITDANKRHCRVSIEDKSFKAQGTKKVSIGISLLKNRSRFEWFLEKATEIGVSEIIPIICERTEKEKFRHDRMNAICISAMLQSQQCWLPVLHLPVQFENLIKRQFENTGKFIAHCIEEGSNSLPIKIGITNQLIIQSTNSLILIGPEGDFTGKEIDLSLKNGFIPVSLGASRLRSETAGIVAASLLRIQ
jgi:16S rRNA (uracil1498-N3)-methyltransferase